MTNTWTLDAAYFRARIARAKRKHQKTEPLYEIIKRVTTDQLRRETNVAN